MNTFRYFVFLLVISLFLFACGSKKSLSEAPLLESVIETEEIALGEAVIMPDTKSYRASRPRIHDLIHMNLSVSFDWNERKVNGETELRLTPYFYESDLLTLDAKGMEVHAVHLLNQQTPEPLEFSYDGSFIRIKLDRVYHRDEEYVVKIQYAAFPDKRSVGGSSAITMDKGLYFINPDSMEVDKPTQIWTQGETESNSVWFPTIDSPNERMTQEIQITVDDKYKTLSNGALIFSNYNGDGTRTDYWKQELPHAPYLVMMAIGDYTVITDSWINADNEEIVVDYYLEPEYAPYARDIFGNTTEMLSFYSDLLGVPYPWDKYSQVVVRDFVSGAMENTSAVIHGDFLHSTNRELLDDDNEDVIAHELFHHWFGDLVTCESWSNLPLNESFATYGEYLWIEHKYGRDAADLHGLNSLEGYLSESQFKQEDLIRFYYDDKEDMFDGHSYNKGGRVLHLLRYFIGDEAFFAGMKLYLEENQFEAVEIHQLRLAMEKVCGKDLNWFFNQWFLGSGHPHLELSYEVDDSLKLVQVIVEQTQDKLFRIPLMTDVYSSMGKTSSRLDIRHRKDTFNLSFNGELHFVNVDSEKILLGTKQDVKPTQWWPHQYDKGPLFLDRYEAVNAALVLPDSYPELLEKALDDSFWRVRIMALEASDFLHQRDSVGFLNSLKTIANNDPKSLVRAKALYTLSQFYLSQELESLFLSSLEDPSYAVNASGLSGLSLLNPKLALEKAELMEGETNFQAQMAVSKVYSALGDAEKNMYFQELLNSSSGYKKFEFTGAYGEYLMHQEPSFVKENLSHLEKVATSDPTWWVRLSGYFAIKDIKVDLQEKAGSGDALSAEVYNYVSNRLDQLLSTETNPEILSRVSP